MADIANHRQDEGFVSATSVGCGCLGFGAGPSARGENENGPRGLAYRDLAVTSYAGMVARKPS
jgi:hypothetical protein